MSLKLQPKGNFFLSMCLENRNYNQKNRNQNRSSNPVQSDPWLLSLVTVTNYRKKILITKKLETRKPETG